MEREFVRWICGHQQPAPGVVLGPGDDAAIVQPVPHEEQLITTDLLMDGVDFLTEVHAPEQIGHKSLAVNLSDLAAMGALPKFALVSLAIPRHLSLEFLQGFTQSINELAARFGVAIIGGDTNCWDQSLAVSITAVGSVTAGSAWLRSGAIVGDRLLVTGACGGSILGRHLSFVPRVDEALWLQKHANIHAAIDVSDGLAWDTSQLVEASGLGAVVQSAKVPVHPAAHQLARGEGGTALHHALEDGEDFELVLAVAPEEAPALMRQWPFETPLVDFGEVVSPRGMRLLDADGQLRDYRPQGYEH